MDVQFAAEFLLITIMLQKKIGSAFVITRNSIKNLDMFLLMKYLNTQCVALNITAWLEIMLIGLKNLMKYFVKLQVVLLVYMFLFL